jgi:glycerophosphoryl diester phosphodiesterase
VLAVVRSAGVEDRVTIQSFDWRTLFLMQAMAPELHTSYLTSSSYVLPGRASPWTGDLEPREWGSIPALVRAASGQAVTWSPDFGDLSRHDVEEALQLGLKVLPWTVNAEADIERMVDWGVSGVISDYPDRALAIVRRQQAAR